LYACRTASEDIVPKNGPARPMIASSKTARLILERDRAADERDEDDEPGAEPLGANRDRVADLVNRV
jgi:hypothetical protein